MDEKSSRGCFLPTFVDGDPFHRRVWQEALVVVKNPGVGDRQTRFRLSSQSRRFQRLGSGDRQMAVAGGSPHSVAGISPARQLSVVAFRAEDGIRN